MNKVKSAAIRTPDGKVHEGEFHVDCVYVAQDAGSLPYTDDPEDATEQLEQLGENNMGFTNSNGEFISRREAFALARESGQVKKRLYSGEYLCAEDMIPA